MHPHEETIASFYEAFANKDPMAMGQLYADDATFSDPVFGTLNAKEARAMWLMLCMGGADLEVSVRDIRADDERGSAVWEARYSFVGTGRHVHNVITASFDFHQGKITKHEDSFDLWKWTRMALGPTGTFLGWTPMVQGKVRSMASRQLSKFIKVADQNLEP